MAQWVLKYADSRGEIRQQVEDGASEHEVRQRCISAPAGVSGAVSPIIG